MRLVAILFVFSLVALAQDSRELMNQGVQAYKSGKYVEAVTVFEKAVDLNPSDVNARLYLATALMSQIVPGATSPENTAVAQRAEAEFQEVLRLDPNDKTALASLASLSYQQAQRLTDLAQRLPKLDESAAWYQRLLAVDPANKEAYYSLGVIDWVKWYPAWMEARTSMGMKPEQPGPLTITAVRQELAQKYAGVIEDGMAHLQKALQVDPQYDDAMAYMNLLIREGADLRDTPEEYRRDIDLADQWVHKALDTKRAKVQAEAGTASANLSASVIAGTPQRIRVGGNVQQANLTLKVTPVYPVEAKAARIQGSVRFTAVIAKSGVIQTLTLVSGHPMLVDAARQAVQQWTYKPTLLNGQPVEVITTIDVNFTLQQ